MDNLQQIKDVVAELHEGLLATYCDLHAHPELSFREWGSAERIAARLEQEGIAHQTIATTGVIAKIEGTAEGADLRRAVVLRADIDALPIEEATGLPPPTCGSLINCSSPRRTSAMPSQRKVSVCGVRISPERSEHCEAMSLEACAPALPIPSQDAEASWPSA